MKKLYLRMLREIKNNSGQFLSIILIIAIGSMLLSGLFSSISAINRSVEDYYQKQNLADIWGYYSGITAVQISDLADTEGIVEAQGRYVLNASLIVDSQKSKLRIHSLTDINAPYMTGGVMPQASFECVIDQKYAQENNIEIGQKLALILDNNELVLTVTGFCIEPEYAYKIPDPTAAIVDNKSFGYAFASSETLIELNKHSEAYLDFQAEAGTQIDEAKAAIDQAKLDLSAKQTEYENKKAEAVNSITDAYAHLDEAKKQPDEGRSTLADLSAAEIELTKAWSEIQDKENQLFEAEAQMQKKLLEIPTYYPEVLFKVSDYSAAERAIKNSDNFIVSVERKNQTSYNMVDGSLDPIRAVSYVFPLIFFIVASVISFIAMSKTVENQRTQIAVMQAIGIPKGHLRLSYLSYAVVCSLLGSVVFALLGNKILPGVMIQSFMSRFALPDIAVQIYPVYIFLPFVLAALFSGAATLFAVQKVLKEVPAQAMRPRPPRGSKTILAERIRPLWRRLNYSSKLVIRNIFLNKTRVVLSSVGIVGCVMLLITGLSLKNSAQSVINWALESMSYDISVTCTQPVADKNAISVGYPTEKVELTQIHNATLRLEPDAEANLQIVEANSSLIKLLDRGGRALTVKQNSVIIPQSLADRYSLKEGDKLTVLIDGKEFSLIVTGIVVEYFAESIYVSFTAAQEAGIDIASKSVLVSLQNPDDIDAAVKLLSSQEGITRVNTKENMVRRSEDLMVMLNTMILIIILEAAVLSMTVIYNITSINIFERTREFATLMVLGYYKNEVNRLILIENMAVTGFGCLFGLPAGMLLFQYIIGLISSSNLRFPSELNPGVAALAIAIAFAFSILTNMLLRSKVKKIVLVEALKSAE